MKTRDFFADIFSIREELYPLKEFFEKLGREVPEELFDNLGQFLSFIDGAEEYYKKAIFFFKRKAIQEKRPGYDLYWERIYFAFQDDLATIRECKQHLNLYQQIIDNGAESYRKNENLNINFTLQPGALKSLVERITKDSVNFYRNLDLIAAVYSKHIEKDLTLNDYIPDTINDEENIFPELEFYFFPN